MKKLKFVSGTAGLKQHADRQLDGQPVRNTDKRQKTHTHCQSDRQSVGQANEEPDFDQGQSDLDQGQSDRRTDRQS